MPDLAPALWLQPGTRLHMVVRRLNRTYALYNVDACEDAFDYEIWTATDSRTGDSSQWHGTFLLVRCDGVIMQMHRDPHGIETELRVM
jgi:hypothetical protein